MPQIKFDITFRYIIIYRQIPKSSTSVGKSLSELSFCKYYWVYTRLIYLKHFVTFINFQPIEEIWNQAIQACSYYIDLEYYLSFQVSQLIDSYKNASIANCLGLYHYFQSNLISIWLFFICKILFSEYKISSSRVSLTSSYICQK